jgi:hypothetical protein
MKLSFSLALAVLVLCVSACYSSETPSSRAAANLPLASAPPVPFVINPGASFVDPSAVLTEANLSQESQPDPDITEEEETPPAEPIVSESR